MNTPPSATPGKSARTPEPTNLLSGLSEDAAELLCAAAEDPTGGALVLPSNQGLTVQAHGKQFVQPNTPRSDAGWNDVLEELRDKGLLREEDSLWVVTTRGFEAADLLNKD